MKDFSSNVLQRSATKKQNKKKIIFLSSKYDIQQWHHIESYWTCGLLETMLTQSFAVPPFYIGIALEISHPCTNIYAESVGAEMAETQAWATVCIFNIQSFFTASMALCLLMNRFGCSML